MDKTTISGTQTGYALLGERRSEEAPAKPQRTWVCLQHIFYFFAGEEMEMVSDDHVSRITIFFSRVDGHIGIHGYSVKPDIFARAPNN